MIILASTGGGRVAPGGPRRGRGRTGPDAEFRRAILWVNAGALLVLAALAMVRGTEVLKGRAGRAAAVAALERIQERQDRYASTHPGRYAGRFAQLDLGGTDGFEARPDGSLQKGEYNYVLGHPGGEGTYRVVATANLDRDPHYDVLEVRGGGGAAAGVRVVFSDIGDVVGHAGEHPGAAPLAADAGGGGDPR